MILPRYVSFRRAFALPLAATDVDGLPVWPVSKIRSGGFTGTLAVLGTGGPQALSVQTGWAGQPSVPATNPLLLTCNAFAADAVTGVHEYVWWLSQRLDDDRHARREDGSSKQMFTITHNQTLFASNRSGTITIDVVPANVATLGFTSGDPFDEGNQRLLFRNVHVYVQRLSDQAIQWAPLYRDD